MGRIEEIKKLIQEYKDAIADLTREFDEIKNKERNYYIGVERDEGEFHYPMGRITEGQAMEWANAVQDDSVSREYFIVTKEKYDKYILWKRIYDTIFNLYAFRYCANNKDLIGYIDNDVKYYKSVMEDLVKDISVDSSFIRPGEKLFLG